ncbi:MAG: LysR family transcriptional regulator [Gemmatimonadaceae bacterium]|nr:LysR family transcriptional regulator [Gemmatimonadaceae bacterium]
MEDDGGLTLDALMVLEAIEQSGSFAAAAGRLHRVPSAVSYTVRTLERRLGVRLFERSGAGTTFTAAGRQLVAEGREILRLTGRAAQRVRHGETAAAARAVVAVGALVPPRLLMAGWAHYLGDGRPPAGGVHFMRVEGRDLWDAVASDRADIAIAGASVPTGEGELESLVVGYLPLALALPPDHALAAHVGPLLPSALPVRELIHCPAMPRVGDGAADPGALTVDEWPQLVMAIRHGLGVGILPRELLAPAVAAGEVVLKEVVGLPQLPLVMAWRAARGPQAAPMLRQWLLHLPRMLQRLLESEGAP